jgi:putative ABC transport system permease protein
MVLGISLGVAVVVAIDLANASASAAFELGTQSITGKATHQISSGPLGVPDVVFREIKVAAGVKAAAPVISEYVSSPQLGGQALQLLGIDPFSEAPFRSYLGSSASAGIDQLSAFLTQPGAVLISIGLAQRYGLKAGSRFRLDIDGHSQEVFIAGLLDPQDSLARQTLDGLVLADISTAQELTGRTGRLDGIDLILDPNTDAAVKKIAASLPAGISIDSVANRQGSVAQMTSAFKVNLSALSMLALVVGLFLIYNSMTFSVVQRRPLFGAMRCLGVTRAEIFRMVTGEALLVGCLGALGGIGLGILLGQSTIRMVTQTVNDLYFTTTVNQVTLAPSSFIKGALMGILATLATAIPPAWEAASVPANNALSRSGLESKTRKTVQITAVGGIGVIALGGVLFVIPSSSLVIGFAGTFCIVVGFAMLSGMEMTFLMRILQPLTGKIFGALGRMAPRNLVSALSRTSIAVSALMVAVAVTIGVSLMISSFRYTVQVWLAQQLQGDVYISAPGFTTTTATVLIDPAMITQIGKAAGIARTDLLRVASVTSPLGDIDVTATSNQQTGSERLYKTRDGSPQQVWTAMQNGSVIVSEPLASRLKIPSQGGQVRLSTPKGDVSFPVVGVYYDYSSSQGTVVMSLDVYRRLWNDPGVTAVDLSVLPGYTPEGVTRAVQDALGSQPASQKLVVRSNATLRSDVMAVFDRTFAITGALSVLATIVAFIGVLSSLLLLQLEKQREVGILRAVGLTVRQLWGQVMLETGLMGVSAGILAMPTGYALCLILVYIINRRSFGWTLQMDIGGGPFVNALLIAITAALLAGIYPAIKLGKMQAADAIRFE